jgi:hypothetical protein
MSAAASLRGATATSSSTTIAKTDKFTGGESRPQRKKEGTTMIWNKEAREESALGRFEIMCEMYNNGSDEAKEIILSFFTDEEKEIFIKGCGFYHLFTDNAFYRAAQKALAEHLYAEFNA